MAPTPKPWPVAAYSSRPALRRRFDAVARQLGFRARTARAVPAWRKRLRVELSRITGLDTLQAAPAAAEFDPPVACDGYRRQRAVIQTEPSVRMPFFILTPDGVSQRHPAPAVITPHGHGSGGKVAVCGIRDNPDVARSIEQHNYDYAVQLVRRGFVVFAPDARGFGERREAGVDPAHLSGSCTYLNNMALPLGRCVTGLWTFDLMRLVDFIQTRPECRLPGGVRIGCAGLSGGGLQTLWLAALDDRIQAAVVSGYFYGYRQSLLDQHQNCSCNYVPNLYATVDMGDLAALIAPRPLLIETGDRDGLNGASGLANVRSQVRIARQAYRLLGADRQLAHAVFQGGHRWDGVQALPFLDRHLHPRAAPASRPRG